MSDSRKIIKALQLKPTNLYIWGVPPEAINFTIINSHSYFDSPRVEHSTGGFDLPDDSKIENWEICNTIYFPFIEDETLLNIQKHFENAINPHSDRKISSLNELLHINGMTSLNLGKYIILHKKEPVDESPYCALCTGCGEDGCCSFTCCFSALIKNDKCEYGRTYLKEAIFAKNIANLGVRLFTQLGNNEIRSTDAVIEFNKRWNEIYDKVFHDENESKIDTLK